MKSYVTKFKALQNPTPRVAEIASAAGKKPVKQLAFWDFGTPNPVPVAQPDDRLSATQAEPSGQKLTVITGEAALTDSYGTVVATADSPNPSIAPGMPPDAAPPDHDASQNTAPDAIPPGWSIQIATGREAMQRRAVRLYSAITRCAGLSPTEMRGVGAPISVDRTFVSAICDAYMVSDERYQYEVAAHRAGEPVNLRAENRRAWDRARKEIGRAFGDLVSIYAADIIVDTATGNKIGYQVFRLPDVYRWQIEHKAKSVYPRPGGGRIIVDGWGLDVCRQRP
jgi:hypothetical protein